MLAVAATAASIVVHGGTLDRRLRGACVAVAAAAGAGTVFSGSRACVLLLAASFVLLAMTCIRVPRRLLALAGVGASMWVLAWVLAWLLPSSNGAGEALASRDQSATGNAAARLDYFAAAWRIARAYPWTGSGADSFGSAGPALAGPFTAPTQWVHNGYLQAFVDAGLVFGLVVTGGVLLVLVRGLRRLVLDDRLLRKGQRLAALPTGALLGVGVLAAHAAIDFDWAYPTLLALLAVLSAIVLVDPGPASEPAAPSTGSGVVRWKVAAIVTGVAAAFLASAGIDAAAATGGPVPAWRSVLTLGWAEGDVPDRLTPASQCRVELKSLLASADAVEPSLAGRLESCLSRVADQDPAAARDIADLRSLTVAARG
jgi:O-antigen ligase